LNCANDIYLIAIDDTPELMDVIKNTANEDLPAAVPLEVAPSKTSTPLPLPCMTPTVHSNETAPPPAKPTTLDAAPSKACVPLPLPCMTPPVDNNGTAPPPAKPMATGNTLYSYVLKQAKPNLAPAKGNYEYNILINNNNYLFPIRI
jgi:hypothetical protein